MAQDIEGLIPDGAKKDLEQIDDLWADILAKTIAYVDTVSKLNTANGVDRTLSSLEDGVNGLSDAYKQYVQGLDDVTAAQKRAADAALKAAKAKTEESKQALNNAKAADVEAKAKERVQKATDASNKADREAAKQRKIAAKEIAELNREMEKEAKANAAQAKREQVALRKEETKRVKELAKEIDELTKKRIKEEAAARITEGTIAFARQQAKLLAKERDLLNITTEEGAKKQLELNKQIDQYNNFVKLNVSAQEQQKINIGNYKSATEGLQRQLGFLVSELPNIGISFRTFTTAISNNMLGFAESIRTAIAANKQMAAEGIKTVPVWKQVASSLLGWQAALAAIAGLLVTYGDDIINFFSGAAYEAKRAAIENYGLKDSVDALIESYQDLEKEASRRERYDSARAKAAGADEEALIKINQKYNQERIDGLEEYGKKLSDNVAYARDWLRIVEKGGVYGAEDVKKAQESLEKITEAQKKNSDALIDLYLNRDVLEQEAIGITRSRQEKESEDQAKENEKRLKAEQAFNARRLELQRELILKYKGNMQDMLKEEMEALSKLSTDNPALGAAISELEINLKGQEGITRDRLKAIEALYADGAIDYKEYEKRKTEATETEATKRLQVEITYLKKLLDLAPLEAETRLKYKEQLAKAELDLLEKTNKAKEAREKSSIENQKSAELQLAQLRFKLYQEIGKAALEVGRIILRQEEKNLRRKQRELEQRKDISDDEIDLETAKEQAKVMASTLSEEEKQVALVKIQEDAAAKKLSAEEKYQAAQAALQLQQEEIERKRFMLQQAAAIASVILTMTQEAAKIKASSILNPALLAGLPLVYAAGAVGVATLAAQTLFYAEGTPEEGHPGGPAVAGEAGAEYVKEPGKAGYWLDTATYFPDMPKGTDVIPMDRFLGPQLIDGGVQTVINQAYDTRTHLKAIERAIKNIPAADIRIEGGALKKSIRVGNYKTEYIRKHII